MIGDYPGAPLINFCIAQGCNRDATVGFHCDAHQPHQPKDRHPNSARFHAILTELGELHDRKQQDYGRGDDPFANVRASEDWGVPAWVGAMVRANDKVRRLQSLVANGKLINESAQDSLRDLAVYAIIALVLYEQETKK